MNCSKCSTAVMKKQVKFYCSCGRKGKCSKKSAYMDTYCTTAVLHYCSWHCGNVSKRISTTAPRKQKSPPNAPYMSRDDICAAGAGAFGGLRRMAQVKSNFRKAEFCCTTLGAQNGAKWAKTSVKTINGSGILIPLNR